MSHEFNKEVDGKKDESCVVHTNGPLRPSLRHRQVFFKSSWDFFFGCWQRKEKHQNCFVERGGKITIQKKGIRTNR